jgi:hypothetical protein
MKPKKHIKDFLSVHLLPVNASLGSILSAIEIYIKEDREKPKYACPNCHRIVAELINIDGIGGFRLGCIYCENDNE